MDGREFKQSEEVLGMLIITRVEPSDVFDLVEEILDAVAALLERRPEARLLAMIKHSRRVHCGSSLFDLSM